MLDRDQVSMRVGHVDFSSLPLIFVMLFPRLLLKHACGWMSLHCAHVTDGSAKQWFPQHKLLHSQGSLEPQ